MSNRYMNQFFNSLEKGKTVLYGQVAIGATGAPTLNALNSKGIASFARTGTGAYTITLQDQWVRLLNASFTIIFGSGAADVTTVQLVADNSAATAKTITILTLDEAGAAADPDNGVVLRFALELTNSTAI